ncbi:dihydroorotase [Anaplasma platys]|uniref:Dihydroorotase n=1 Tax=Anaplasma platys TaxID=949 RepID=A0A858PXL6_9RICK|nr:dihydroorotase [Anaplasma platys]QJC27325.1 dihydroorotase [Anaplasma platys]
MKSEDQSWHLLEGGQRTGYVVAYINARVIDPESGTDCHGYLLTNGQHILGLGPDVMPNSSPKVDEVVDCQGNILMPGMVDIHVHLREPGGEHKETIDTGSRSAAAGGITTVVCQPNTSPRIENSTVANYLKKRALESSCVNIEFYGAVTSSNDTLCDLQSLHDAGALGFTDDGSPVMNALHMKQAFECARSLNLVVAQHAEDCNLSNKGCINEGHVSRQLGLRGIPDISESIIVSRDIQLLREVPEAHYHVLHISTKKALDEVRAAKKEGLKVTCEVAPHHFTLNETAVLEHGPIAKMNPPLRTEEDRISMISGLKDGTIDCIATDHAPHAPGEKAPPISCCAFGIVGLETMLPLSLELHFNEGMSLLDVLAKLTSNPAKIVGLKRGQLREGWPADLAIFSLEHQWEIDIAKFASKSKNSPFNGRKVRGKVLRTVVAGKTVYSAGSVV